MSKTSKLRLAFISFMLVILVFLLIPEVSLLMRIAISLFFVGTLIGEILFSAFSRTINWSKEESINFLWDKSRDILQIVNNSVEDIDKNIELYDVVEELGRTECDGAFQVAKVATFDREKSQLVMDENGYQILKNGTIRLKIRKNAVVSQFFSK